MGELGELRKLVREVEKDEGMEELRRV